MSKRNLIVIGPSGVGKSSIFSTLHQSGHVEIIPTWTTRKKRHYESTNSLDHVFVNQQEFERRYKENFFIDTAQLFGLDYYYGLPHFPETDTQGPIRVFMLRSMLLSRIDIHIPDFIIYQVEAPFERVQSHLALRAERDGDVGSRLDSYSNEIRDGRTLAHRVIDNSMPLEHTLATVRSYMQQDFHESGLIL